MVKPTGFTRYSRLETIEFDDILPPLSPCFPREVFPLPPMPLSPEIPTAHDELRDTLLTWWTTHELIEDMIEVEGNQGKKSPDFFDRLNTLHLRKQAIFESLSAEAMEIFSGHATVHIDGVMFTYIDTGFGNTVSAKRALDLSQK